MKHVVIIVSLCLLLGCASTDEGPPDRTSRRGDCIYQASIRGYKVLDEQNLIIDASARKQYHVTLQRRAYGLRNSWNLGVIDSATGSVCAGFSEIFFNNSGSASSRYRIASIRQITPEEEEDLLIRFGLKEPEVEKVPVPQDVEGADIEALDPDVNE